MTKEQAYKIIEDQYGGYRRDRYLGPLCLDIRNEKIRKDWRRYWKKICEGYIAINDPFYYYDPDYDREVSLTRLMLLHDFIEDTYK